LVRSKPKSKINALILFLILFSLILSGCTTDDGKDDSTGDKDIEIFYQIKVEYSGSEAYSIQVPVFIDENAKILKLNDMFQTKYGTVKLSYNYTGYGPSLLIESDGSFCIEINESFKNKAEFTNDTAGLSLFGETPEEYWIYSSVSNENLIKLTFTDDREIFEEDGSILMESKLRYIGNLKPGWHVIKGELYEFQK
jgi:hypothetical protein